MKNESTVISVVQYYTAYANVYYLSAHIPHFIKPTKVLVKGKRQWQNGKNKDKMEKSKAKRKGKRQRQNGKNKDKTEKAKTKWIKQNN